MIYLNKIAQFIKTKRKEAGLTQEEFAMRSGLGCALSVSLSTARKPCVWIKSTRRLLCLIWKQCPGEKTADIGNDHQTGRYYRTNVDYILGLTDNPIYYKKI